MEQSQAFNSLNVPKRGGMSRWYLSRATPTRFFPCFQAWRGNSGRQPNPGASDISRISGEAVPFDPGAEPGAVLIAARKGPGVAEEDDSVEVGQAATVGQGRAGVALPSAGLGPGLYALDRHPRVRLQMHDHPWVLKAQGLPIVHEEAGAGG